MTVIVPIKTITGMNAREPWQRRAKRVAAERKATALALLGSLVEVSYADQTTCILLTRHAKKCDDDNLSGALKGVRDEVAKWLGIDDGDARVQYCYEQQRCKQGQEHVSITFGHVTQLMRATADNTAARALLRRWLSASDHYHVAWRDTARFLEES